MTSLIWNMCLITSATITSGDFNFRILHTNDVHAHVEQSDEFGGRCKPRDVANNRCYGGVARRQTAIDAIRRNHSNVILLDAGDQFQGSAWFTYYKGYEVVHFMKNLGYDAMCLGNHEFDNGVSGLIRPFLESSAVPVLTCNINMSGSPEMARNVQKYLVLNVSGESLGIVGYVTRETAFLSNADGIKDITFLEPIPCVQGAVEELQLLGVNKIIALGHSGFAYSLRVAREVRGVDIVVDGHTNTFLYNGLAPSVEKPIGPYPVVIEKDGGGQALVYQAYAYGKYLGNADVTFSDDGDVVNWSGNPILLDASWPEDARTLADVERLGKPLDALNRIMVGESFVYLQGGHVCEVMECNTGDLIADALLHAAVQSGPTNFGWSNVTIAFINGGSIRAPIHAGTLSLGDMTSCIPIPNRLQIISVSGSTIRRTLEHSVTSLTSSNGHFLQMSGMRVKYDVCNPEGSRVRDVTVVCADCDVPRYVALLDDVIYNVVTTDYLVGGGDGHHVLRDNVLEFYHLGVTLNQTVTEFIGQRSPLTQGVDGRISFIRTSDQCVEGTDELEHGQLNEILTSI